MSLWTIVAVVGAVSMVIRVLPMACADVVRLGPRARQAVRHAGIGAMTALLIAAVLPGGVGIGHLDVGLLLAVSLGVVLAWRRSPMVVVVVAGAAVYLVVTVVTVAI